MKTTLEKLKTYIEVDLSGRLPVSFSRLDYLEEGQLMNRRKVVSIKKFNTGSYLISKFYKPISKCFRPL